MKIQGSEYEQTGYGHSEADADWESAVALIGMSGRFPGASSVAQLWENLTRGELGLRAIGDEEAIAAGVDPALIADPGYVRVGGPVAGVEMFDAAVFGFTEREAEIMEPQHRLLLECAWEALESAGYRPTEPGGVVGIYAGCSFPDYMLRNVRLAKDPEGAKSFAAGNERDSLTSLVSYKLGLRGPGVTVQSFCSTSLVAVHLACQSLLTYETDIALAGGASLPLPQPAGYVWRPDGIYSPDGRVRPFDAEANGTVVGSAVGVVALKRMADAVADGDVIHAVIRGSAVNNDGRERAGYSAPGVDGQAEVIEAALAVAGVKAESVGYVECHAVGTPLGDSIELAALGRVFRGPVLGAGSERAAGSAEAGGARTPGSVEASGTRVLGSVGPSGAWASGSAEPGEDRSQTLGLMESGGTQGLGAVGAGGVLVLGSLKPAVGHLDAASGVTALIRAALCLRHALLPAVAGFETASAALAAAEGRFTVLREDRAWPGGVEPRRAGVSSFGVGGTNAHVVLEEAPVREVRAAGGEGPQLLAFSAADEQALDQVAERLRGFLRDVSEGRQESVSLADVAFTLQVSRGRFAVRRAVVCRDLDDAVVALGDPGRWIDGVTQRRDPRVRLVVPEELSAAGWAELGEAIARVVSQDAVGVASAQVLQALRTGLDGLGVRTIADGDQVRDAVELAVDPAAGGADEWIVAALGRLWIEGSQIDWNALHQGAGRRVELPAYPFQRKRYWIDADVAAVPEAQDVEMRVLPYVAKWRPLPRPIADLDARLRGAGPWLLVGGGPEMSPIELRLLMAGAEVMSEGGRAGAALRDLIVAPRMCVIHPGEVDGAREVVDALREVLPEAMPGLVFLTSQAVGVSGADLVQPEQASVGAFAARVGARHIDTDAYADVDQTLAAMVGEYEGPTAVRGADVWVRDHEVIGLDVLGPCRDQTIAIVGSVGADGLQSAVDLLEAAGAEVITLDGVCGGETADRFIALCPDSAEGAVLAAHAHAARQKGQGRWLTLSWDASIGEGDGQESAMVAALRFLEGAVAASDHLAHIVVSKGLPQHRLLSRFAEIAAPATESSAGGLEARPNLANPYVEPEAGLERSIADAWIQALNVDPIGADDNFFELGGRSITAVQLAASIGAEQSVTLPATAVVEHPTVRALASRIRELTGND